MIHNVRQYRITKAQVAKFERALKEFDSRASAHPSVHPRLIRAQCEALQSQLETLQQELWLLRK